MDDRCGGLEQLLHWKLNGGPEGGGRGHPGNIPWEISVSVGVGVVGPFRRVARG